jgi:predicted MFS family arabinose efflux permease
MYTLLIISLLAQVCIAIALEFMITNYLWLMYGMRSLFGIAGEGMFTVQSVIVAKYAKSDYEIMMGICLSFPFLMDSINSAVTTAVYDATGYMALPWYIGSLVCFISLLAAVILNKKYLAPK